METALAQRGAGGGWGGRARVCEGQSFNKIYKTIYSSVKMAAGPLDFWARSETISRRNGKPRPSASGRRHWSGTRELQYFGRVASRCYSCEQPIGWLVRRRRQPAPDAERRTPGVVSPGAYVAWTVIAAGRHGHG